MNMNKQIYLKSIMLLMIITLIGVVLADTDTNNADDTFKINTRIDYKKACFNNGTYCSNSAVCNYTVFNPDKTILLNNQRATNKDAYHNISFYVDQNGMYQIDMTCIDGSRTGAETFSMEITGNGLNDTVWFYVLIIIFSMGVMGLGFYLSDAPIVILGTFGLYFLGIYILRFGIVGIKDLTTTWGLGIILLGVAFYVSSKSAYELITDMD